MSDFSQKQKCLFSSCSASGIIFLFLCCLTFLHTPHIISGEIAVLMAATPQRADTCCILALVIVWTKWTCPVMVVVRGLGVAIFDQLVEELVDGVFFSSLGFLFLGLLYFLVIALDERCSLEKFGTLEQTASKFQCQR